MRFQYETKLFQVCYKSRFSVSSSFRFQNPSMLDGKAKLILSALTVLSLAYAQAPVDPRNANPQAAVAPADPRAAAAPAANPLEQKGNTVTVTDWKGTGSCNQPVDFTAEPGVAIVSLFSLCSDWLLGYRRLLAGALRQDGDFPRPRQQAGADSKWVR
jgi:hypothetical protein